MQNEIHCAFRSDTRNRQWGARRVDAAGLNLQASSIRFNTKKKTILSYIHTVRMHYTSVSINKYIDTHSKPFGKSCPCKKTLPNTYCIPLVTNINQVKGTALLLIHTKPCINVRVPDTMQCVSEISVSLQSDTSDGIWGTPGWGQRARRLC